jgi:hypothetical protein
MSTAVEREWNQKEPPSAGRQIHRHRTLELPPKELPGVAPSVIRYLLPITCSAV